MGGGGEHFHDTSSSNDHSRGVEEGGKMLDRNNKIMR
jgi:hypothetical protein